MEKEHTLDAFTDSEVINDITAAYNEVTAVYKRLLFDGRREIGLLQAMVQLQKYARPELEDVIRSLTP